MREDKALIPQLRTAFNEKFTAESFASLLALLEKRSGTRVEYRIAETPVFMPLSLLDEMAAEGASLARTLIGNAEYLRAARQAIPAGYGVARETPHPHFLTADFALVRVPDGRLTPRLVEIQAFPSVYGFQSVFSSAFRQVYSLPADLGAFLSGLDDTAYWDLLARTILGGQDPENVVLTEVDPQHQKTRPDFEVTAARLGIAVVDISTLEPVGNKLHYRNSAGRLVPIHRIYNRAIADELMARSIRLPFDLAHPWDVEWAGHPDWYFLISKFSLPWLSQSGHSSVPPAVFLSDFLDGEGRQQLEALGVLLPSGKTPEMVYSNLLLKPLFSFAGKGIQFEPTQAQLEQIPSAQRGDFLLQLRMDFVPTIDTPAGMTQAEVRILYLWPDGGSLTPVMPLVRLGRGKMMGVDHNRNQEWVGASAAFFPVGS